MAFLDVALLRGEAALDSGPAQPIAALSGAAFVIQHANRG
jgi:hypothetical protein